MKFYLFALISLFLLFSCKQKEEKALSPEDSLKHFVLEDGFEIKLVASEPLVQAPVAMSYDESGRIWVLEMTSYMQDTLATGQETQPSGKIVILEDEDGDGEMDNRKVFMDSLILPRAMAFYRGGLLVAEPPRLWYVKIDGDTAGVKYVVDEDYAEGGTAEHQPNGLMRGIDNWLYNAKSDKRYRMVDGKWKIEHTQFRGQWGISQDDDGRLFYNNNSVNLLGDYYLPGVFVWNKNQRHISGFDELIVPDNRTYPIHATAGVNRGYQHGVLHFITKRLKEFTAACGPVIYRSDLFGKDYYQNAFVAEPAANLIKRNILEFGDTKVSGKQAYSHKEFLASDDERFRPVNLYNGPDGALYIVDMYRGIIQDAAFITPYLKKHIADFDLTTPLNRGRIYKVVPKGKTINPVILKEKTAAELVEQLGSPDSWVRETAQRLLVDENMEDAESLLREKLHTADNDILKIHAFWTLEGLGKLNEDDINSLLNSGSVRLQKQAITAIISLMTEQNADKWLDIIERFEEKNDSGLTPYLAFAAARAMEFNSSKAYPFLSRISLDNPNNSYVVDAVLSGLDDRENTFFNWVKQNESDTTLALYKQTNDLVVRIEKTKSSSSNASEKYANGFRTYTQYCQACHGEDGEGLKSLGAPLNGSQWVNGDKKRLISIILYGLTGPIKVGDKLYQEPEVGGEMPAFAHNDALGNSDLAALINYIRHAWNNNAEEIDAGNINEVRRATVGRTKSYTMEELDSE